MIRQLLWGLLALVFLCSCKDKAGQQSSQASADNQAQAASDMAACPTFAADSAMNFILQQCAFGPRVTGTEAHLLCGDYIVSKFKAYGTQVTEQKAELTAYDGTKLPGRNIIASINPESQTRLMFCAHWDCRPWADNDVDEANHHIPIIAANDAASGVAVMLEMARQMQLSPLNIGIDFICFDAEDWGTPQWDERNEDGDGGWCLGSKYWSQHPHVSGYWAQFGVLLDMVGGRGATFAKESYSSYYAQPIVDMTWNIAGRLGYGNIFQNREGGAVTDDHVQVNQFAGIPCIDIIPNCKGAVSSSFGPTWHTVNDTPENIDPAILKAVGQTMLQVVYNFQAL